MLERFNIFCFNIIVAALTMTICGLVVLYSAGGESLAPWAKQVVRISIGLLAMLTFMMVPTRPLMDWALVFYLGVLTIIMLVAIIGKIGMGAQRWLHFYFLSLQPSELMKPILPLVLASFYQRLPASKVSSSYSVAIAGILVVVPCVFVLLQPDLGTALILAAVGVICTFMAGVGRAWFVSGFLSVLISLPLIWRFLLHSYQKSRILMFLNPYKDPTGRGYQVIQSKIALFSGGFFGKGFTQGSQSQLGFLPEKHTDFIFAFLCEEFGILGGMFVISVFIFLNLNCFVIAIRAKNSFSRIVVSSISFLLFFQFFTNILMVMGLLPVVGIPLPFLSFGGSSILTSFISLGIIMSISMYEKQKLYTPVGYGLIQE